MVGKVYGRLYLEKDGFSVGKMYLELSLRTFFPEILFKIKFLQLTMNLWNLSYIHFYFS